MADELLKAKTQGSVSRFDLEPLKEAVAGDIEILTQVISMFISSTRENLDTLRQAIDSHDAKAVRVQAHHLKGSLLEVGATGAVELVLELEKMGETNMLDNADQVWKSLDQAVRQMVLELDKTEYRRIA